MRAWSMTGFAIGTGFSTPLSQRGAAAVEALLGFPQQIKRRRPAPPARSSRRRRRARRVRGSRGWLRETGGSSRRSGVLRRFYLCSFHVPVNLENEGGISSFELWLMGASGHHGVGRAAPKTPDSPDGRLRVE